MRDIHRLDRRAVIAALEGLMASRHEHPEQDASVRRALARAATALDLRPPVQLL